MVNSNHPSLRGVLVLFVPVLTGILTFGLWPFGKPPNEVTWLSAQHAVHFTDRSTILSTAPLTAMDTEGCTVEMWLRPALSHATGTLLAFYGRGGPVGISWHQSQTDLRLDTENGWRSARYYVPDALRAGKLEFLSVVGAAAETQVYVNGSFVQGFPSIRSALCSGQFVLGDSPRENDSFRGDLAGLAIYKGCLTPAEVRWHYQSWKDTGAPEGKTPDALYLFDEGQGQTIHDHGIAHADMFIPDRYTVVQQTVLETPWNAFEATSGYVQDVLVNISGFIPVGVIFGALLAACGQTSGIRTLTILAGFLLSLTIETIQSRLPTRDSDLTDVCTNTLGSAIGAFLYAKYSGLFIRLVGFRWLFLPRAGR